MGQANTHSGTVPVDRVIVQPSAFQVLLGSMVKSWKHTLKDPFFIVALIGLSISKYSKFKRHWLFYTLTTERSESKSSLPRDALSDHHAEIMFKRAC